jgi:hypothetical protein
MDCFENSKTPSNGMPFRRGDDHGRGGVRPNYAAGRSHFKTSLDDDGEEEDVDPGGIYRGSQGYRAENQHNYSPPSLSYRYERYDSWGHSAGTSSRRLNRSTRFDQYGSYRASSSSPADQYDSGNQAHTSGYNGGTSAGFARHPSVEPDIPSLVESDTSSFGNPWDEDLWNSKSPCTTDRYATTPQDDRFSHSKCTLDEKISSNQMFNEKERAFSSSTTTIEVSPGEHLRLRGAEETWRAVQVDFYMPSECMCCTLTVFCIQDASFILCPACRVVSPMVGASAGCQGGVGLGFTMEDLAKWQQDIHSSRKQRMKY